MNWTIVVHMVPTGPNDCVFAARARMNRKGKKTDFLSATLVKDLFDVLIATDAHNDPQYKEFISDDI